MHLRAVSGVTCMRARHPSRHVQYFALAYTLTWSCEIAILVWWRDGDSGTCGPRPRRSDRSPPRSLPAEITHIWTLEGACRHRSRVVGNPRCQQVNFAATPASRLSSTNPPRCVFGARFLVFA